MGSGKTQPVKIPADAMELARNAARQDERPIGAWIARLIRAAITGSPDKKIDGEQASNREAQ